MHTHNQCWSLNISFKGGLYFNCLLHTFVVRGLRNSSWFHGHFFWIKSLIVFILMDCTERQSWNIYVHNHLPQHVALWPDSVSTQLMAVLHLDVWLLTGWLNELIFCHRAVVTNVSSTEVTALDTWTALLQNLFSRLYFQTSRCWFAVKLKDLVLVQYFVHFCVIHPYHWKQHSPRGWCCLSLP